jgi:hypothetical protein
MSVCLQISGALEVRLRAARSYQIERRVVLRQQLNHYLLTGRSDEWSLAFFPKFSHLLGEAAHRMRRLHVALAEDAIQKAEGAAPALRQLPLRRHLDERRGAQYRIARLLLRLFLLLVLL